MAKAGAVAILGMLHGVHFAGMPRDGYSLDGLEMCRRFVGLGKLDKDCEAEFGISFSMVVREGVSNACWWYRG